MVVPITKQEKRIPAHVTVRPPEAGLLVTSFIKCEDVRCVAVARFGRFQGRLSERTLDEVTDRLRILLGL